MFCKIFKSTYFEENLQTATSGNIFLRCFNFTLKTGFFNINFRNKRKCLFLLHGWFPMKFLFTYNISLVWWEINFRSSHCRCSVKKGVLKNFAKSTGKHLCLRSATWLKGLRSATVLKKRLWQTCFPVNFVKFLRTPLDGCFFGRMLLKLQILNI